MKVLLIEDDDSIAGFIKQALRENGYAVEHESDGAEGFNRVLEDEFDAILLDVMLPGIDGFSVCRQLRAQDVATPILMLTARDTLEDKIEGLDAGADDYIIKPFQVGELLARLRAMLRRQGSGQTLLKVADLVLDPKKRAALRAGKGIALSATEYSLVEFLMRHAGRTCSRAAILEHVWQYDFGGNDNVLEVYISYLRRKIDRGHEMKLIHTVRGEGYRMAETC